MTSNDKGIASTDDEREDVIGKANLIWDEYKYRHDLIWRHLIRSTLAVVALVTVAYSDTFDVGKTLVMVSGVLAVGFSAFNLGVVNAELKHYWRIRDKHTKYQGELFDFTVDKKDKTHQRTRGFAGRVNVYLSVLIVIALGATLYQVLTM